MLTASLPALPSSFVGRTHEVAELRRLLIEHRLVTLAGSGGCGKTRLAIESARDLLPAFADRVWLVELASLAAPALVPQTVAAVLDVRELPGEPLTATLCAALAPHHTLLVLDNCEHLIGACAELVDSLLQRCPQLHILATSRTPLGIAGELVWAVPPLSYPAICSGLATPAAVDLLRYAAVQLFVARAAGITGRTYDDPQELSVIGDICRRLDGLPLAIELAAARTHVLSAQQIAARLDDRFELLARRRAATARHQSLEAAQQWSYDLLSAQARAAFRRLAVFAGGWSLEAAETVCAADDIAPREVLGLLSDLVDQSLVVMDPRDGEARYRLLESVRQYAHKQLVRAGEQPMTQDRHLAFFAGLVERSRLHLTGGAQATWFARLERELDNLRAAMDWSLKRAAAPACPEQVIEALHLPTALERFWSPRGYSSEGAMRLQRALALLGAHDPAVAVARAAALNAAGVLAWFQGRYADAERQLQEALAIGYAIQHPITILEGLRNLGTVVVLQTDIDEGIVLLERGLALGRALGETGQYSVAWILAVLGSARYRQGDDADATALFEEAIALLRELGDANFLSLALRRLGQLALRGGDLEQATAFVRESIELNSRIGSQSGVGAGITALAGILFAKRRAADAARLLGVAETQLAGNPDQRTIIDRELFDSLRLRVCIQLGPEMFAAAWAEGRQAQLAGAGASMLERAAPQHEQPEVRRGPRDADALTPREREIAVLVAHGYSNRRIAQVLTVEVKTVEAHLTRILAKLEAASRVQVATWAIDAGLAQYRPPVAA
jgi:predicted ATPase/DNA-binding CsgD family transcriptional regulator